MSFTFILKKKKRNGGFIGLSQFKWNVPLGEQDSIGHVPSDSFLRQLLTPKFNFVTN